MLRHVLGQVGGQQLRALPDDEVGGVGAVHDVAVVDLARIFLADALEVALRARALDLHADAGIVRLERLGDLLGDRQVDRGVPGDLAFLLRRLDQRRRDLLRLGRRARTGVHERARGHRRRGREHAAARQLPGHASFLRQCPALLRRQVQPHRLARRDVLRRAAPSRAARSCRRARRYSRAPSRGRPAASRRRAADCRADGGFRRRSRSRAGAPTPPPARPPAGCGPSCAAARRATVTRRRIERLAAQDVAAADEARDELRPRPAVDLLRRAELLDPAEVHHRDQVGRGHRLGLVVGHVDRGVAILVVQAADLEAHLLAQVGVEVRERLVEQQGLGLDHQRAGQRHALLLAARQLAGIALGQRLEPRRRQDRLELGVDRRLVELPDAQAVGDVLGHRHVRPQRVALEDHRHVAAFRRHGARRRGQDLAADHDFACRGLDEARDQPQRRGLAAARRAQQADELAMLDAQATHRRRPRPRRSACSGPSVRLRPRFLPVLSPYSNRRDARYIAGRIGRIDACRNRSSSAAATAPSATSSSTIRPSSMPSRSTCGTASSAS